jgi:hypothetical protein
MYIQSRGFLYICSKIITMLTWICNFSNSFHVYEVFLTRWSILFCKAWKKLKMCRLKRKIYVKNFLFLGNWEIYIIIQSSCPRMYYGWCKRYKYSSVPIGTVLYIYLRLYTVYAHSVSYIYVDGNGYLKYMNVKVNGKIGDSEEDSIQTR